ncbi:hypothetical protein FBU59_002610 [Linderina macrospora]|uniref:Uncharacterized protein n=1 Tax=Linderina macrospora TaxID=4868 RepID=A0ACC1JAM0_9FUNG|nr:hypothetical protein FBU59_002610 [Linderina macrospora]
MQNTDQLPPAFASPMAVDIAQSSQSAEKSTISMSAPTMLSRIATPAPMLWVSTQQRPTAFQHSRFRHQRTLSVQGIPNTPYSADSSTSSWDMACHTRRRTRASMAESVNRSITQGLPIDPDALDMDDSDDADIDSTMDDWDNNSGAQSMVDGMIGVKREEPPALARRMSLNVPRNKAFVRLLSLVEEDRPLAAEMAHEAQITRTIRHNNVHEWLRSPHQDETRWRASRASSLTMSPGSPNLMSTASSSSSSQQQVSAKRKRDDSGSARTESGSPGPRPYKRVAMSPSGLRAQISVRSGSSSTPLRPVAFPSQSSYSPTMTAGACPVISTRTRSRSGVSVASVGGFSRMNISDKMDDDEDDNEDTNSTAK